MRQQDGQVLDARIFPSALDAERALLGGAIMAPDQIEAVGEVVQPTDFYRPDHAALWLLLALMNAAGEHVDLVSVTERVARGGKDEDYGGLAYMIGLVECTPSTANLCHYAGIIAEKARLRRLIASLQEATATAFEESRTAEEIAASVMSGLDTVSTGTSVESDWFEMGDLINAAHEQVCAVAGGAEVAGFPVGLPELAEIVSRIVPAFYVIGGRPAMGKTALALLIAKQIAEQGAVVGVFSLEMDASQLAMRELAQTARRAESDRQGLPIGVLDGMTARDLAEGRVGEASWSSLDLAREIGGALPIKIATIGSATMDDIEARTRRLARWGKAKGVKIGAIVIDYLGLIMRKQGGGQTDASAIAGITERLKRLQRSTGIAIICLAQLNRQCEQREDKRPRTSDLRDSGGIEQDADVVMFVYRDVVYNPDADPHAAEIIVTKQRNGKTGTAEVRWSGQSTEFYSEQQQTHKLAGYEDFQRSGGL